MFLQIDFGWHLQNITGDSHDSVRAATRGGNCRSVKYCERKDKKPHRNLEVERRFLESSAEICLEIVVSQDWIIRPNTYLITYFAV